MKKAVIFGTGSVAESLFPKLDLQKVNIVGFVDDKRQGEQFHGYDIYSTHEIRTLKYDVFIIASGYVRQISNLLIEQGVTKEKIIGFIYDEKSTYLGIADAINRYLDQEYNRNSIYDYLNDGQTLSEIYPATVWNESIVRENVYKDFVREQLLKMIADQLYAKKVTGDVAELGVYRGDFTVVIDEVFPDRVLYLFDTFSGFSKADVEIDDSITNKVGEENKFKDTSTEVVLDRLKNKNRARFKVGYFPDSFDLWDQTFAFVSIDLNLEKPVKDALNVFYPRMQHGGMILVSDYYAPFYGGTRISVDSWCEENGKVAVPIPDFYGSALIVKD